MGAIERDLQTIIGGTPRERRKAVRALVATATSGRNLSTALKRLAQAIEHQSDRLYQPTPDGLKTGEPGKYRDTVDAAIAQQAGIQAVLGIVGPDGLLDDQRLVGLIDRSGMLERLGQWPHHITTMQQESMRAVTKFKRRHRGAAIEKVKIYGLGGSAAPHDIAADIVSNFRKSSTEIEVVHADEPNPDYVSEKTLAMFCSFSGNTEETVNCYRVLRDKTKLRVILAKGGELGEIARSDGIPFIQLPAKGPAYVEQPRESVCLQMTATLTFLARVGLEPGSDGALTLGDLAFEERILPLLREWRARCGPHVPFKENAAKQLAFFLLYGIDYRGEGELKKYDLWKKRVPFILVDRNNKGIGHEVRTQIHERSKLNAAFYDAPEFLHNLVESVRAGSESAVAGLDADPYVYYFVRSLDEEPRIRLRLNKTIELVMDKKADYAVLEAAGDNAYERALFATYFNAHMTTYLAILNGFDPLPVPTMSWLKNVMKGFQRGGQEEQDARSIWRPGFCISTRARGPRWFS